MAELIVPTKSWQGINGVPLNNGKIYIGIVDLEPVANPKSIFSDRELTTPLANPVLLDSYGNPTSKVWLEGRYSIKIEDSSGAQVFLELDNGEEPGVTTTALTGVLGSNAITADASPAITSLADNSSFVFEVVTENDADAVTLAIGTTGAKAIKRNFDQDVGKGKFKVGQKVEVVYNEGNDNYEWMNENARVIYATKGADIASATTVNLALATGNKIDVTGHDGPITGFGTVLEGVEYDLTFPGSPSIVITSSSIANPTNILCATVHGYTTGDTVFIDGHSGSVPSINGTHVVTVVDTTNFTIPVNVSTGGTGGTVVGVPVVENNDTSLQLAGQKDRVFYPGDVLSVTSLGSGNWRELYSAPSTGVIPTGAVNSFIGTIAPRGWILLDGGTIGSETSGATNRAHSDTEALYTLFYNSMADGQAPVSTGRGASASADFAANKTITISDLRGAAIFGTGGTAPATHGDSGGSEDLVKGDIPTLDITTNLGTAGSSTLVGKVTNGSGTEVQTDQVNVAGDGTGSRMPPWVSLAYICKL